MAKIKSKLIRPFGPSIGKFTLPKQVVEDFNEVCDLISESEQLSSALDHSQILVGKVRQELTIPQEVLESHAGYFNQLVSAYLKEINRLPACIENNKPGGAILPLDARIGSHIRSGWIVRSFAGDYNPIHMHPDAVISCAGFLKVPDWEEELKEDKNDHYGLTHGCLTFSYGDVSALSQNSYVIRPKVGDIYMFPGWLQHAVYPFRSAGERRSFSLNIVTQIQKKNSEFK